MVGSWEWSAADRLIHALPLHHVHGVVNCLAVPLWCGAAVEFLPQFTAGLMWDRLVGRTPSVEPITLLMAVPTIYQRLLAYHDASPADDQRAQTQAIQALRLCVSGSAALPVPVFEKWKSVAGFCLLERYGMTEIGMCLSNPLRGERLAGHVGLPLPGVDVRVSDRGELQVKGPTVFHEYFRNEEKTREAFTSDGWFRTGDEVEVTARPGGSSSFKIVGRQSVDILKVNGFKVSALEIEATVLSHDAVAECAVIGVSDVEQGQRVVAIARLQHDGLTLQQLRAWCVERAAHYKAPAELYTVQEIPRNVMGKVNKKTLLNDHTGLVDINHGCDCG